MHNTFIFPPINAVKEYAGPIRAFCFKTCLWKWGNVQAFLIVNLFGCRTPGIWNISARPGPGEAGGGGWGSSQQLSEVIINENHCEWLFIYFSLMFRFDFGVSPNMPVWLVWMWVWTVVTSVLFAHLELGSAPARTVTLSRTEMKDKNETEDNANHEKRFKAQK